MSDDDQSTPIAEMVKKMLVGGMSADMVVLAVHTAELIGYQPVETIIERRRRRDREYRADKRRQTENAPSSLSSSSSFFPKREKEEEEKKKESKPLPPKSAPLPAHWQPSAAHFEEGAALGFSRDEIVDQAKDMQVWAGANAHRAVARKSSWDLTFSGWMRRTRKSFVGQTRRKAPTTTPAADGAPPPGESDFRAPWIREGWPSEDAWREAAIAKEVARWRKDGASEEQIKQWLAPRNHNRSNGHAR